MSVAYPITPVFAQHFASASDTDLVATAINGQEGSFEELVRRYQRPISAYVYRMVGNYESALDLTQEIFIKVYSSLSRYRAEFKFSTWIYKIPPNPAQLRRRSSASKHDSPTVASRGSGRRSV